MPVFFILVLFLVGVLPAFPEVLGVQKEHSIAIKIAQYSRSLDFACPNGAEWALGGLKGNIPNQATCNISGVLKSQAVRRFHIIVGEVSFLESEKIPRITAPWVASGWPIHTIPVGQRILSSDSKTIIHDGRTLLIGIAIYNNFKEALELLRELNEAGYAAWVNQEVVFPSQGTLTLRINGQVQASGNELEIYSEHLVRLLKVEYAAGYPWHGFADRNYRGKILFRFGVNNAIDCVFKTGLESVLSGVVQSEISAKAETGALQAQAVAARGMIVSGIGRRHIGEGFDTCSEQHCQVYAGETSFTSMISEKILPTAGLVLGDLSGNIVSAVYSSNCGGHREANHFVWDSPPNPILGGGWDTPAAPNLDLTEEEQAQVFIKTAPNAFCSDPGVEGGDNPRTNTPSLALRGHTPPRGDKFRWKKTISSKEWAAIEKTVGIGRIKSVINLARGLSGRIYQLTMVGANGSKTIKKELTIRQLFGSLRSSCFLADWRKDSSGYIIGADLMGAGFGHGVGMCQTGAQGQAKQGWPFSKILAHYYPGSILKKN